MKTLHKYVLLIIVIAGSAFGVNDVFADNNIDCKSPVGFVQEAICNNRKIFWLDRDLGVHYKGAIARSEISGQLQSDQDAWVRKVRDACQSESCLRRVYTERIRELDKIGFDGSVCSTKDSNMSKNIWGRIIKRSEDIFGLYVLPNGEVMVGYSEKTQNSRENNKPKIKFSCFYSGKTFDYEDLPRGYFSYNNIRNNSLTLGAVSGPDGIVLNARGTHARRCSAGTEAMLEMRRKNKSRSVAFVYALANRRIIERFDCELSTYDGEYKEKVSSLRPVEVVMLDDGGFAVLVESGDIGYVVRFNQDLQTKFQHKSLSIIDYEVIVDIERKTNNFQDLHDSIYDYVTKVK